jgi:hypothetical protein
MKHDWQTQCTLCLGIQTEENKDDDRCSGGAKLNRRRSDGAIPKSDLVHGRYYYGRCRNASIARWDGIKEIFIHWRQKFGDVFLEEIKCREDELHFDVFDPFAEFEFDHSVKPIPVSDAPEPPTPFGMV